jgi:type IV pilus assembly protein PilQ
MVKNRNEEIMKTFQKISIVALVALIVVNFPFDQPAYSQQTEKRVLREFVLKDEIVSMTQSTPFDKAMSILGEVGKKYLGKIIIDPAKRTTAIGVDVKGMHWQDAFEWILRANNLWYNEYQDYFEITGIKGVAVTETGARVTGEDQFVRELVDVNSREVRISAVFFNVDLNKMHESGINWKLFRSSPDDKFSSLTLDQRTIQKLSDTLVFNATLKGLDLSFGNLDAILRLFSETNIGEVISNPQIIVRSSEKGRIQVGEDISVKRKDFAGNTIIELIPTGTIIEVTPHVIKEGDTEYIYLNLDVERSVITALGEAPTISRTKAKTSMLMLDNEEAVLGGLYSNFDQTIRSGLPILKDLPWWVFGLRYIFGYDKTSTAKKELTILLKTELVPTLHERIARKTQENHIEQQRMKFEKDLERYKSK